jgi:hypothetical protein
MSAHTQGGEAVAVPSAGGDDAAEAVGVRRWRAGVQAVQMRDTSARISTHRMPRLAMVALVKRAPELERRPLASQCHHHENCGWTQWFHRSGGVL